jgi:hypothetical protein
MNDSAKRVCSFLGFVKGVKGMQEGMKEGSKRRKKSVL